jgi:hypothetical protein
VGELSVRLIQTTVHTKLANILKSVIILLLGLIAYVLVVSIIGYSDPPGTPPLHSDPMFFMSLALLPILWCAARFWFWFPIFFGYGALAMFPLGWTVFGPQVHHGFAGPLPSYYGLKILLFCCICGLLSVSIGHLSSHAHRSKLQTPA